MHIHPIMCHASSARAESAAQCAKDATDLMRWEINDLRRRADALTIACQALWELLAENTNIPQEAIHQKMQEIDLRDGVADGKSSTPPPACPSCGRNSNANRKSCLDRGEPLPSGNVFPKF